jgi:hypothetical protein
VGLISSSYKAVDIYFVVWLVMRKQTNYVEIRVTRSSELKNGRSPS